MNAEIIIEFLVAALSKVDKDYYGGRIEGWMFDNHGIDRNHPKRKSLEKYLDRYGERVFCYELYHQVRVLIDNYYAKQQGQLAGPKVTFQGELRKNQIESVIQYFANKNISPLKKEYIPDFLLHSIGNFDGQELIVEVKTNPLLTKKDIKSDLAKIQEFISKYGYRKGVFISINSSSEVINTYLRSITTSRFYRDELTNKADITFIHKQGIDTPLSHWTLDMLPAE